MIFEQSKLGEKETLKALGTYNNQCTQIGQYKDGKNQLSDMIFYHGEKENDMYYR
ncbi:MAG: hypothetical protein K5871_00960 [Lachnospiraceae bacterium]|nr:hypothetical protein [Lachnospiraceae bacterium]